MNKKNERIKNKNGEKREIKKNIKRGK